MYQYCKRKEDDTHHKCSLILKTSKILIGLSNNTACLCSVHSVHCEVEMIGGNSYITICILPAKSEPVLVYCPTLNCEDTQKLFTFKKSTV